MWSALHPSGTRFTHGGVPTGSVRTYTYCHRTNERPFGALVRHCTLRCLSGVPCAQVYQITVYNTERKYSLGSLIAVNKEYICYALRDGALLILSGQR